LMTCILLSTMYMSSKARTVFDNIEKICAERSKESPLVSYHFRSDLAFGGSNESTNSRRTYSNAYYIEVSISDQPPVDYDNDCTGNCCTSTDDDVASAKAIAVGTTSECYCASPQTLQCIPLFTVS
jgi:hypothetical protein